MANDNGFQKHPAALDRAFPALWLLVAAAFAVIVLMVFCGWRIFLLEAESREIARERLLLERDRDEFMTYGGDLPQLVQKHKSLELETKQFEAMRGGLRKEVRELEEKRESLNYETRDLIGAISELRAQSEVINAETAKIRAELEKLRPEGEAAVKRIAQLQSQEKILNESIAQKQKRESALAANIEGLDRQRAHAQQLLGRISEDRMTYAEFEKNMNERLAKFDGTVADLVKLNGNYGERLEEMAKVRTGMSHGLETLNVDLQGIAGYLENIKKDRAAWSGALTETAAQNRDLREQVENLGASARRFIAILDNAENSNKTFQATLLTEAAVINRMASEDARARTKLEETAAAFGRDQESLKNLVAQVRSDSGQIRTLLTSQQGELASVAEAARVLSAQMEKGKHGIDASVQAGVTLSHAAVTLADQVDEVRARLKQADSRGAHMEEMLTGQAERLKNLTALARELAAEIDESRRQGMRFQDVMASLRATLEDIKRQTDSADDSGVPAKRSGADNADESKPEEE